MQRISILLLLSILGWIVVLSVSAQEPDPARASEVPDQNRGTCGGVFTAPGPHETSGPRRAPDDWIEDFGYFVLRMSSSVSQTRFDYVVDLLDTIVPSMVEILGAPVTLDTLTLEFDNSVIQHYSCYDNTIVMNTIRLDPAVGTDPGWDNLFIHELTHAFQGDFICGMGFPSWLTEAMA